MLGRVNKTLFAAVAALTLSAALASCGPPYDLVAVSGADSENVLVHGVVEKDGKPVTGAQVWLTLWPEDDDTPEGDVVDTRTEDSVTTDGDGRFLVSLDPDELEPRYFNGEYLNFDIEVWNDGQLGGWSSTVNLIDERFWRQDDQEGIADDALKIDFDLGNRPTITLETLDGPDEHELTLSPLSKSPNRPGAG